MVQRRINSYPPQSRARSCPPSSRLFTLGVTRSSRYGLDITFPVFVANNNDLAYAFNNISR